MNLSTFGLNVGNLELGNRRKTLELKVDLFFATVTIIQKRFCIQFQNETVLEVPFSTISQCAVPGKNEVEIQFEDDDTGNSKSGNKVGFPYHF